VEDFCPQDRVQALLVSGAYTDVLKGVRPATNDVDYSIVNLECLIVTDLSEHKRNQLYDYIFCEVH